ncbi:hypothetical protein Taro_012203 [Colocasia esculenta]|uniref:Uncharacterized protein n=1 Tax=Colocasia esculenta TaxID=4460 RepID=A0A843U841_COLES|nr:hypothetical protein [Colocasia esculenta]
MSPSEDDMWLVAFQLGRRLALCRLPVGKATGPMSPYVCASLREGTLRGVARLVGGGSWIAGARRWRVASLREGPLRLDLHIEVRLHSSSVRGVARRHRSVSPSGSPDPWAAVPTVGSLVGAGDPGAGAVTGLPRLPLESGPQHGLLEVERQLDLSSVAARLRGGLVLFVWVKESRRVLVPLLVRDLTVVESGIRHQQITWSAKAKKTKGEASAMRVLKVKRCTLSIDTSTSDHNYSVAMTADEVTGGHIDASTFN